MSSLNATLLLHVFGDPESALHASHSTSTSRMHSELVSAFPGMPYHTSFSCHPLLGSCSNVFHSLSTAALATGIFITLLERSPPLHHAMVELSTHYVSAMCSSWLLLSWDPISSRTALVSWSFSSLVFAAFDFQKQSFVALHFIATVCFQAWHRDRLISISGQMESGFGVRWP